jgi:hypothetical protein
LEVKTALKRKRLTDAEIRAAVDKIRVRHKDYIEKYLKGRHTLDTFEDRYIEAMRARLDMAIFLHAEMTAIEDLIKAEQQRIEKEQQRAEQVKKHQTESLSFADKIIAEHRERIAKYPPIQIHAEASDELERLYGCLSTIEREIWPGVEKLMRAAYTSIVTSPRARLEERIITLSRPVDGNLSPRLSRYQILLSRIPASVREIEKEEKSCLLDAAFFLHDLSEVLDEMKKSPNLDGGDKEDVDKMLGYVHNLIDDFRLKDLRTLPR